MSVRTTQLHTQERMRRGRRFLKRFRWGSVPGRVRGWWLPNQGARQVGVVWSGDGALIGRLMLSVPELGFANAIPSPIGWSRATDERP